jgi:pimeloyl-ACP methyl ester carboxylesterase
VLTGVLRLASRRPDVLIRWTTTNLDDVDDTAASSPIGMSLRRNALVAVETGSAGLAREAMLYVSDWGFALSGVACPVDVWTGGLDRLIPEAMGRSLAELIPRARLHLEAEEGHFGLLHHRTAEILAGAMPSGASHRGISVG